MNFETFPSRTFSRQADQMIGKLDVELRVEQRRQVSAFKVSFRNPRFFAGATPSPAQAASTTMLAWLK
ncbi:MAG: hypothetical protein R3D69_13000 [Xanthobacteraceae bacterium]